MDSILHDEFKKPTIQELINQLEQHELFYKNNPHIKKLRIVDYISLVPVTPMGIDDKILKLYSDIKNELKEFQVIFIK